MRARYRILFLLLLLTLLALPLMEEVGLPAWLIKGPVGVCLFAAIMPNATGRNGIVLLVTVGLLVAASLIGEVIKVPTSDGFLMAIIGLFGLFAALGTLRYTVKSKQVDGETICAALSTYLLAGLFFGQIYWAIESLAPGSVTGPDPMSQRNAVYFSFVTIATLGYGDFLPRTPIARGVATFEVIGGQLYLAVMVARLVSLFAPAQKS